MRAQAALPLPSSSDAAAAAKQLKKVSPSVWAYLCISQWGRQSNRERKREREGGRCMLCCLCALQPSRTLFICGVFQRFLLPSLPACVLRLALLFFLHIPTRKIHRARCDDVGIKTPATNFVAHKFNSLRPVCVLCPAWHVATLRRCCSSCGRQVR